MRRRTWVFAGIWPRITSAAVGPKSPPQTSVIAPATSAAGPGPATEAVRHFGAAPHGGVCWHLAADHQRCSGPEVATTNISDRSSNIRCRARPRYGGGTARRCGAARWVFAGIWPRITSAAVGPKSPPQTSVIAPATSAARPGPATEAVRHVGAAPHGGVCWHLAADHQRCSGPEVATTNISDRSSNIRCRARPRYGGGTARAVRRRTRVFAGIWPRITSAAVGPKSPPQTSVIAPATSAAGPGPATEAVRHVGAAPHGGVCWHLAADHQRCSGPEVATTNISDRSSNIRCQARPRYGGGTARRCGAARGCLLASGRGSPALQWARSRHHKHQ